MDTIEIILVGDSEAEIFTQILQFASDCLKDRERAYSEADSHLLEIL